VKVRAILNPRAGVAAQRARGALETGAGAWGAIPVEYTQAPGHARELARQAAADGLDLLLAAGGDGTMNEVAEGLLGSNTALGLVPVGSGNGLARTLGIPLEPRAALRALEGGVTRRMDVGLANGRPFLNLVGAGFDAHVGAAFHRHARRGGRRGIFSYVRLSLLAVWRYAPLPFRVQADAGAGEDFAYDGRALVVACANGRQYGAGAVLAPRARLDDGRLDVVVIEAASPAAVLLQVPRIFSGRLERFSAYRGGRWASGRVACDSAFPFHRDGEPEEGVTRLDVSVLPRALSIRVAAAVSVDPRGPFDAR
jgi:YegS/Rv2252/BmrU family lipid kinase